MSNAPRHRTSWLSQNYDKLVLVLILVGLLLSALVLFSQIGRKRQELTEGAWIKMDIEPKPVAPIAPLLARFDQLKAALDAPFQSGSFSNRMMVSELRVSCVACQKPIPFNSIVCPFCHAKQPDMPGTNLNEAADFPSPATQLRFLRIGANPFKLRFQGEARLSDGSVRYQLNLRSLQKTYFARVGDEIEGFKIVEYSTNTPAGPTIVLEQGDTRILLVKGKMREGLERVADLVFLIDQSKMQVRLNDTIKLDDREYKIIDIQRNSVLIRDEKTKETTPVGRLLDSEKSALEGGVRNPSEPVFTIPGNARPSK